MRNRLQKIDGELICQPLILTDRYCYYLKRLTLVGQSCDISISSLRVSCLVTVGQKNSWADLSYRSHVLGSAGASFISIFDHSITALILFTNRGSPIHSFFHAGEKMILLTLEKWVCDDEWWLFRLFIWRANHHVLASFLGFVSYIHLLWLSLIIRKWKQKDFLS